jgi:ribonuclease VapC
VIVDTSALVAVLLGEAGWEALREALTVEPGWLPAPALAEFTLVSYGKSAALGRLGDMLLAELRSGLLDVVAFDAHHAAHIGAARARYGKGNGLGGQLNLLDLMVYAVAKERGEPLLFTGQDFSSTDIIVHPASRTNSPN